ncbi:MAG: class I SAM-dependent methyltransferase [Steroidobacteraceae bacterium]|jgi:hypothetical protein|nr:class I SAM-dependent methyltransferase [Steroidobacteraceae bacterium]
MTTAGLRNPLALAALVLATAGLGAVPAARAQDRAACEKLYAPSVGQSGKDVIWVPTPDELVTRMLEMARTTSADYVVDLGAGDGKIPIAAARQFGARAKGIEYNPDMVKLAQCLAKAAGVAERARIVQGDIFKEDFRSATVVTMYLLPELNIRLRPTLLEMRPGTRVVSHAFDMDEWQADEEQTVDGRTAYLWIVPARVGGRWEVAENGGEPRTLTLNQQFQQVTGSLQVRKGVSRPLKDVQLRGDELRFAYDDERGRRQRATVKVQGDALSGSVGGVGPGRTRALAGRRLGAAPPVYTPAAAPAQASL